MLFSRKYSIERFWRQLVDAGESDDLGYLRSPRAYNEWMGQSELLAFDSIQDVRCLVLLGEPGIGKTEWCKQNQPILNAKIEASGNAAMWVDLGECGEAEEVTDAVFQHKEFVEWGNGTHSLHLFLDGFDECHSHVPTLPKLLIRQLRKSPAERLFLRILCRTSEWPPTLQTILEDVWKKISRVQDSSGSTRVGDQSLPTDEPAGFVRAFELAPLRPEDVAAIIEGEGFEVDSLLAQIESMDVWPFAVKPQTLALLLKVYRSEGRSPSSQVELYRKGCRELCREPNQARTDSGISRNYSSDERFALASRAAAMTVYCNRLSILSHDIPPAEIKKTDIAFGDLLVGNELVSGKEVPITESLLRDTLNTGLFTGRGHSRMGWAHRTFAEFLAAECLIANEVPLGQIMTLIQHAHEPEVKIPVQLAETASWLALMKQDVMDLLMRADPEILLLKSHRYTSNQEQHDVRRRLVKCLLRLLDDGILLDYGITGKSKLGDLSHPTLADQLRPYIADRTKNFVVRRVAVKVARENKVGNLQKAICDVALDDGDDYLVRVPAARALLEIADADHLNMLKPLVFGLAGDDPDDELKGYALLALWPDNLTPDEVFDNLTPPRNRNFFGAYRIEFLHNALLNRMTPAHLPAALRWVCSLERQDPAGFTFDETVNAIMAFAWDHLEEEGVLNAFAEAALHRLNNYIPVIPSRTSSREDSILFEDDQKRRRVVQKMVELVGVSPNGPKQNAMLVAALVRSDDIPWLAGLFESLAEETEQEVVAWLICWFFQDGDTEYFETLSNLSEKSETFRSAFSRHIDSINLDSEDAEILRARWESEQAGQEMEQTAAAKSVLSQDRITEYLSEIEEKDASLFVRLAFYMLKTERESDSFYYLPSSSTELQVWKSADTSTRARLFRAALAYIHECNPQNEHWFRTTRIPPTAVAGYYAFRLIRDQFRELLSEVSEEAWIKWAPALIVCPESSEDSEAHALILDAYKRIPDEMVSNLMVQIDFESRNGGYLSVLDKFGSCWDTRLQNALSEKLEDQELTLVAVESLLRALLEHDVAEAVEFAKAQLQVPVSARGRPRQMALVAAKCLMLYAPEEGWLKVWPAIAGARLFGRRLVHLLAQEGDFRIDNTLQRFSEDCLATLHIWISKVFPPRPRSGRMTHAVGPRDLAEQILGHLQRRATMEALGALSRLQREIPGQAERLSWIIAIAKDRFLASTWRPWTPSEILAVISDHRRRLVQSGHQLLDVVLESLNRFQQSLFGEIPAVRDLWDRQVGKTKKAKKKGKGNGQKAEEEPTAWRPVREMELSDRIARHLRDDLSERGMVIGREVQIRPGEETDIHVDAVSHDTRNDRLGVGYD